ncbi:MAG: hypothetical protein WDW38_001792 [Sanguina aurantia]
MSYKLHSAPSSPPTPSSPPPTPSNQLPTSSLAAGDAPPRPSPRAAATAWMANAGSAPPPNPSSPLPPPPLYNTSPRSLFVARSQLDQLSGDLRLAQAQQLGGASLVTQLRLDNQQLCGVVMEQHQRLLAMGEHAAAAGEARQALAAARERRGAEALALAELSSENQALASGNQALASEIQALARENQALASGDQALSRENQALSSENQALASGNQALSREVQALQGALGDVRARGEAGEAALSAELQRVLSGQGAVVAGLQEENGRLRELAQSAHEVSHTASTSLRDNVRLRAALLQAGSEGLASAAMHDSAQLQVQQLAAALQEALRDSAALRQQLQQSQVEVEELADNVHAAAVASIAAASRTASPARALLPHPTISQQYWEATGSNGAGQHRAGGGDQTVLAVAGLEHQANAHFLEGNSMLLDKYRQAKAETRRPAPPPGTHHSGPFLFRSGSRVPAAGHHVHSMGRRALTHTRLTTTCACRMRTLPARAAGASPVRIQIRSPELVGVTRDSATSAGIAAQELSHLTAAHSQLQAQLASHLSLAQQAAWASQAAREGLQVQVEEEREGRAAVESHVAALRERHALDLAALKDQAVDLESELRAAGRLKVDMKDAVARLKVADGLTAQLRRQHEQSQQLQQQQGAAASAALSTLKESVSRRDTEVEALTGELDRHRVALERLHVQLCEGDSEKDLLRREVQKAAARLLRLEGTRADLKKAVAGGRGLQADVARLERELESATAQLLTARDRAVATQQETDHHLEEARECTRQQHVRVQAQLASGEEQRKSLEEQVTEAVSRGLSAEEELAAANARMARYLHTDAQLLTVSSALEQAGAEAGVQQQAVMQLQRECAELRAKMDARASRGADLERETAILREKVFQADAELASKKTELERHRADLARASSMMEDTVMQTSSLQRDHQVLEATLRETLIARNELASESQRMAQQCDTYRDTIADYQESLSRLQRQASTSSSAQASLSSSHAELQQRLAEASAAVEQLQAQAVSAAVEQALALTQAEELESCVREMEAQNTLLRDAHASIVLEMEAAKAEVRAVVLHSDQLESDILSDSVDLQRLQGQVKLLVAERQRKGLQHLSSSRSALQQQLQQQQARDRQQQQQQQQLQLHMSSSGEQYAEDGEDEDGNVQGGQYASEAFHLASLMDDETHELEGELAERQNAGQQLQARLSRAKDAVGRRLTSLSAQLQASRDSEAHLQRQLAERDNTALHLEQQLLLANDALRPEHPSHGMSSFASSLGDIGRQSGSAVPPPLVVSFEQQLGSARNELRLAQQQVTAASTERAALVIRYEQQLLQSEKLLSQAEASIHTLLQEKEKIGSELNITTRQLGQLQQQQLHKQQEHLAHPELHNTPSGSPSSHSRQQQQQHHHQQQDHIPTSNGVHSFGRSNTPVEQHMSSPAGYRAASATAFAIIAAADAGNFVTSNGGSSSSAGRYLLHDLTERTGATSDSSDSSRRRRNATTHGDATVGAVPFGSSTSLHRTPPPRQHTTAATDPSPISARPTSLHPHQHPLLSAMLSTDREAMGSNVGSDAAPEENDDDEARSMDSNALRRLCSVSEYGGSDAGSLPPRLQYPEGSSPPQLTLRALHVGGGRGLFTGNAHVGSPFSVMPGSPGAQQFMLGRLSESSRVKPSPQDQLSFAAHIHLRHHSLHAAALHQTSPCAPSPSISNTHPYIDPSTTNTTTTTNNNNNNSSHSSSHRPEFESSVPRRVTLTGSSAVSRTASLRSATAGSDGEHRISLAHHHVGVGISPSKAQGIAGTVNAIGTFGSGLNTGSDSLVGSSGSSASLVSDAQLSLERLLNGVDRSHPNAVASPLTSLSSGSPRTTPSAAASKSLPKSVASLHGVVSPDLGRANSHGSSRTSSHGPRAHTEALAGLDWQGDGGVAPPHRKHTLEWQQHQQQQQHGELVSPSSSATAAELRQSLRKSLAELTLQGSSPRPTHSGTPQNSSSKPAAAATHAYLRSPMAATTATSLSGASPLSTFGMMSSSTTMSPLGANADLKRRLNLSSLQIPGSLTLSLASASASSSPRHLPLTSPLQAAANALLLAQPGHASHRPDPGTPPARGEA